MNSHQDEKKFSCSTCNKSFSTNRQLRKHVVIHRSRKLQCNMCPKKFIYPYEMQAHMMVHTGYKPFSCQLCDLKFRFSWNVKKHMEKCHKGVDINAELTKIKAENVIEEVGVVANVAELTTETPIMLEEGCDSNELITIEGIAATECINENGEIYYEYV